MAKIQACKQFNEIEESYKKFRILLFQGGTRSGKTYSIMMWLIIYAIKNPNAIVNIFRKTRATIESSVLKDFKDIMDRLNLYNPVCYNKATMKYSFDNGSVIKFMGCDDPEKVKGVKSDIAYLNEVSSFYLEDYRQIAVRAINGIIMDYNPNMATYHFIFKEVIPRDDSVLFKSTYKDNPFLSASQIQEIERYKHTDENYWRIYGLGEQGISEETIFPNFEIVTNYDEVDANEYLGMDFGYNDPTTLGGVKIVDKEKKGIYIKQYLYKRKLTPVNIISETKKIDVVKNNLITADSARPEIISQMVEEGLNVEGAKKGTGSVYSGILKIKEYKIHLDKGSPELIEEFSMSKWQKHRNGVDILEKPEEGMDHLIDAVRYAMENVGSETPYFFGVV